MRLKPKSRGTERLYLTSNRTCEISSSYVDSGAMTKQTAPASVIKTAIAIVYGLLPKNNINNHECGKDLQQ
jgi:hypothetical protein